MMKSDIRRIISAELYKAARRRTSFVLPAIMVLLSGLLFVTVTLATQRDWVGVASGFYLVSATMKWMVNVVALVAVVMGCFQISGEFALGTIKPSWVRPVSRNGWFAGKFISAGLGVTGLFILVTIVVVALSWIKFGFTDVIEKDYVFHTARSMAGSLVVVSLLTAWSLWAAVSVISMISTLFVRPGSAISVVVFLFFLMVVLSMFPQVKQFLLTNCLSEPFEHLLLMSKGIAPPVKWSTLIWKTTTIAGVWMVVSLAASLVSINKKEITF